MANTPTPAEAGAKSGAASGLSVGDAAPGFDLPASFDRRVRSSDLSGSPYVLYFYPKADTSGCTKEACDFQEALGALAGAAGSLPVIGVSRDPMPAIEAFAQKFSLQFPLATDDAGATLEAYGVWVEKSMYGRRYMGIERTTLLVDAEGSIARIWTKVKVPGHAAEVVKAAGSLT
ncbi:peroxiredoxin [Lichenicoccus sp.]|uniref:peroxiredoxin n=1 Tax=Lichenicoccus sp. TaxID=2781899 RepID=UPI003D13C4C1